MILLVEDHQDTATAIKGHLELSGVTCVCVSSVVDALEAMSKDHYEWLVGGFIS